MRSVGPDLFHADGWTDRQTDMTKPKVAFRTISNAPNMKGNRIKKSWLLGKNVATSWWRFVTMLCAATVAGGGETGVVRYNAYALLLRQWKGKCCHFTLDKPEPVKSFKRQLFFYYTSAACWQVKASRYFSEFRHSCFSDRLFSRRNSHDHSR